MAPTAPAVMGRWMVPFVGELGDWARAARLRGDMAVAASSGLDALDRSLARVSSLLRRSDQARMFKPAAGRLQASGAQGHGIADWGASGTRPREPARVRDADAVLHVHVVNAHEIGHATGDAVNRGLRVPAAVTPSLPAPATMPWAPGLMPAIP